MVYPFRPGNRIIFIKVPQPTTQDTSIEKKQKRDDDFIAKVLEGFEMPSDDQVGISVHVEEVSTFQSSTSTSTISQRLSPPQTSTSSVDITQERFLSQSWKQRDVQGLISTMKQTKSKNEQLRQYIEKLLSMKREEIANLSVSTEASQSFPSNTDSIGKSIF